MLILKNVCIVLFFIVCFALIILTMKQSKDDEGLSSTITGSSSNNFFDKNKGNTREGKQKRIMVWSSVVFAVLTVVLGILYLA